MVNSYVWRVEQCKFTDTEYPEDARALDRCRQRVRDIPSFLEGLLSISVKGTMQSAASLTFTRIFTKRKHPVIGKLHRSRQEAGVVCFMIYDLS